MKRTPVLCLWLALLTFSLGTASAQTTNTFHVHFSFTDSQIQPQGVKKLTWQRVGEITTHGTNMITRDPKTKTVDATGQTTISNNIPGIYIGQFSGSYTTTPFTNYFGTNIADGATVEAADYLLISTNLPSGDHAYSMAQVDALLSQFGGGSSTNATSISGEATNTVKTLAEEAAFAATNALPYLAAGSNITIDQTSGATGTTNTINATAGGTGVSVSDTNRFATTNNPGPVNLSNPANLFAGTFTLLSPLSITGAAPASISLRNTNSAASDWLCWVPTNGSSQVIWSNKYYGTTIEYRTNGGFYVNGSLFSAASVADQILTNGNTVAAAWTNILNSFKAQSLTLGSGTLLSNTRFYIYDSGVALPIFDWQRDDHYVIGLTNGAYLSFYGNAPVPDYTIAGFNVNSPTVSSTNYLIGPDGWWHLSAVDSGTGDLEDLEFHNTDTDAPFIIRGNGDVVVANKLWLSSVGMYDTGTSFVWTNLTAHLGIAWNYLDPSFNFGAANLIAGEVDATSVVSDSVSANNDLTLSSHANSGATVKLGSSAVTVSGGPLIGNGSGLTNIPGTAINGGGLIPMGTLTTDTTNNNQGAVYFVGNDGLRHLTNAPTLNLGNAINIPAAALTGVFPNPITISGSPQIVWSNSASLIISNSQYGTYFKISSNSPSLVVPTNPPSDGQVITATGTSGDTAFKTSPSSSSSSGNPTLTSSLQNQNATANATNYSTFNCFFSTPGALLTKEAYVCPRDGTVTNAYVTYFNGSGLSFGTTNLLFGVGTNTVTSSGIVIPLIPGVSGTVVFGTNNTGEISVKKGWRLFAWCGNTNASPISGSGSAWVITCEFAP